MLKANCHNCSAACCKGPLVMSFTEKEAEFMEKGGNTLLTIVPPADHDREDAIYPAGVQFDENDPEKVIILGEKGREFEPLAAGLGRYIMLEQCGYLKPTGTGMLACSVYDERPQVCRDFEMGGDKCLLLRKAHGVD